MEWNETPFKIRDKIFVLGDGKKSKAIITGFSHGNLIYFRLEDSEMCGVVGSLNVMKREEELELKKGATVMFKANFDEAPNQINTAKVIRVAKDKSWIDISSFWGRKRVPNLGDNIKVVNW